MKISTYNNLRKVAWVDDAVPGAPHGVDVNGYGSPNTGGGLPPPRDTPEEPSTIVTPKAERPMSKQQSDAVKAADKTVVHELPLNAASTMVHVGNGFHNLLDALAMGAATLHGAAGDVFGSQAMREQAMEAQDWLSRRSDKRNRDVYDYQQYLNSRSFMPSDDGNLSNRIKIGGKVGLGDTAAAATALPFALLAAKGGGTVFKPLTATKFPWWNRLVKGYLTTTAASHATETLPGAAYAVDSATSALPDNVVNASIDAREGVRRFVDRSGLKYLLPTYLYVRELTEKGPDGRSPMNRSSAFVGTFNAARPFSVANYLYLNPDASRILPQAARDQMTTAIEKIPGPWLEKVPDYNPRVGSTIDSNIPQSVPIPAELMETICKWVPGFDRLSPREQITLILRLAPSALRSSDRAKELEPVIDNMEGVAADVGRYPRKK